MRLALLAAFPLHVIPGQEAFPPAGHYATWLPQLAAAFAHQSEFDIHWLVISRRPVPAEPIRWLQQTFHLLHVPGRLRLLHGYRRECRLLRARVEALAPDLVHAWGTEHCYALAASGCRRPWLLSMQGILLEYLRRQRMHPFVYVQAIYEWLAVRRAREISVESKWGRSVMQRRAPQAAVHLVEYGVQPRFFETAWHPDPTQPSAIFIGTPEPRKGLADAIAAFADPRLAHCQLQVVADADAPLARTLRARATPNVRWLGRLPPQETAAALAQAWCLVLPTRADTSPNVVKEARVMGLPVVSTPHGGQSDYITDGVNGYLVEPGDIARLADRLAEILQSLPRAQSMGAAGWAEQREHFRPQHTADAFLQLYRQLTASP